MYIIFRSNCLNIYLLNRVCPTFMNVEHNYRFVLLYRYFAQNTNFFDNIFLNWFIFTKIRINPPKHEQNLYLA